MKKNEAEALLEVAKDIVLSMLSSITVQPVGEPDLRQEIWQSFNPDGIAESIRKGTFDNERSGETALLTTLNANILTVKKSVDEYAARQAPVPLINQLQMPPSSQASYSEALKKGLPQKLEEREAIIKTIYLAAADEVIRKQNVDSRYLSIIKDCNSSDECRQHFATLVSGMQQPNLQGKSHADFAEEIINDVISRIKSSNRGDLAQRYGVDKAIEVDAVTKKIAAIPKPSAVPAPASPRAGKSPERFFARFKFFTGKIAEPPSAEPPSTEPPKSPSKSFK